MALFDFLLADLGPYFSFRFTLFLFSEFEGQAESSVNNQIRIFAPLLNGTKISHKDYIIFLSRIKSNFMKLQASEKFQS